MLIDLRNDVIGWRMTKAAIGKKYDTHANLKQIYVDADVVEKYDKNATNDVVFILAKNNHVANLKILRIEYRARKS